MQAHGPLFTLMFSDLIAGQPMCVVGSNGIFCRQINLNLFLTGESTFCCSNLSTRFSSVSLVIYALCVVKVDKKTKSALVLPCELLSYETLSIAHLLACHVKFCIVVSCKAIQEDRIDANLKFPNVANCRTSIYPL